jgi:hypothetical protein
MGKSKLPKLLEHVEDAVVVLAGDGCKLLFLLFARRGGFPVLVYELPSKYGSSSDRSMGFS